MKKILYTLMASALSLTALTACQSTQKSPQWVNLPIAAEDTGNLVLQYDQNSVVKSPENANWRNVLVLSQPVNAATSANAKYASMTFNATIDCENKAIRLTRVQAHTLRDGMGEIVDEQEINGTFEAAKDPANVAIINTICR